MRVARVSVREIINPPEFAFIVNLFTPSFLLEGNRTRDRIWTQTPNVANNRNCYPHWRYIAPVSRRKNGKAFVVKGRQRRQHNNVRLVFSEAKMFRGKLVNILLSIVKSMILEFVLSARKHPYNHMGSLVTCLWLHGFFLDTFHFILSSN